MNFGEGRGESVPGLVEVDVFFCKTLSEKVSVDFELERTIDHMDHLAGVSEASRRLRWGRDRIAGQLTRLGALIFAPLPFANMVATVSCCHQLQDGYVVSNGVGGRGEGQGREDERCEWGIRWGRLSAPAGLK